MTAATGDPRPVPRKLSGSTSGSGRATVAVFDFDGTLTRYDSYLRFLRNVVEVFPRRAPRGWCLPVDVLRHKLGWQSNSWLKARFLTALAGGLSPAQLARVLTRFQACLDADGFRQRALAALRRHQAEGHSTVLLSAGFDLYLKPVSERLGFDHCVTTVAETTGDGTVTGRLAGANCYGEEKLRRLAAALSTRLDGAHVIAYGDHASDLPLLAASDEAYVVNPSAALRRKAAGLGVRTVSW